MDVRAGRGPAIIVAAALLLPGCTDIGETHQPVTLASGQSNPIRIAVDSTSVYWTNDNSSGTVMKVPLAGGSPTTLASGQGYPYGIAVDSTSVYWTNNDPGTVMSVPLSGGAAAALASGGSPAGIAVDSTSVYWTNYTDPGTVMKIVKN